MVRCSDCLYKEHTSFGEDVMEWCDLCGRYVCITCLKSNYQKCGEQTCHTCCDDMCFHKTQMIIVVNSLLEQVARKRIIMRIKQLKEELMMMTWKVDRVEPWCGESWTI